MGETCWPFYATKQYHEWKGVNFSPIVGGGVVLIPFTNYTKTGGCTAVDCETGKDKWTYEESKGSKGGQSYPSYHTPVLATFGGEPCAIFASRPNIPQSVYALRLSDGKEIWRQKMENAGSSITSTYFFGNELVCFSMGGIVINIDVNLKTAPFASKAAVGPFIRGAYCYHAFAPSGDALYGFLGTNEDTGKALSTWTYNMACMDRRSSKILWTQEGFKSACSVIAADNLLFARSFHSLYLIEATTKGYVQKGIVEKMHDVTNDGGNDNGWVLPVLSNGKLYVRCPGELICFDVSGKGGQGK
jgi:hypothetical protein